MSRTLSLVAIAVASGVPFDEALALVDQMAPTLPGNDIEAARAIAAAVTEQVQPI